MVYLEECSYCGEDEEISFFKYWFSSGLFFRCKKCKEYIKLKNERYEVERKRRYRLRRNKYMRGETK